MRLEPPKASDMDDAQLRAHAAILAGPRGKVEGPLGVWLHSAVLAERAQALGAFCRFDSSLEPRLSELAILVCGIHWRAGFEWAVHAPIAQRAGVDPAVIEAMRTGAEPEFERDDEAALYRFARSLLEKRFVSDAIYRNAVAHLGARRLVDLVGVLGYYGLICMTINAFEVPLPAGSEDPFPPPPPAE